MRTGRLSRIFLLQSLKIPCKSPVYYVLKVLILYFLSLAFIGGSYTLPSLLKSNRCNRYRFLTPVVTENVLTTPNFSNPSQGNAPLPGAPYVTNVDPIKVPVDGLIAPGAYTGETSPTGVVDFTFPIFGDAKDAPHWYSKGADVEELLDEADALDWLADSGDLDETYSHILSKITTSEVGSGIVTDAGAEGAEIVAISMHPALSAANSASLPEEKSLMNLPSLFDQAQQPLSKRPKLSSMVFSSATEAMEATLPIAASSGNIGEDHFAVFDSAFDEQAFVSALLDSSETSALPALS